MTSLSLQQPPSASSAHSAHSSTDPLVKLLAETVEARKKAADNREQAWTAKIAATESLIARVRKANDQLRPIIAKAQDFEERLRREVKEYQACTEGLHARVHDELHHCEHQAMFIWRMEAGIDKLRLELEKRADEIEQARSLARLILQAPTSTSAAATARSAPAPATAIDGSASSRLLYLLVPFREALAKMEEAVRARSPAMADLVADDDKGIKVLIDVDCRWCGNSYIIVSREDDDDTRNTGDTAGASATTASGAGISAATGAPAGFSSDPLVTLIVNTLDARQKEAERKEQEWRAKRAERQAVLIAIAQDNHELARKLRRIENDINRLEARRMDLQDVHMELTGLSDKMDHWLADAQEASSRHEEQLADVKREVDVCKAEAERIQGLARQILHNAKPVAGGGAASTAEIASTAVPARVVAACATSETSPGALASASDGAVATTSSEGAAATVRSNDNASSALTTGVHSAALATDLAADAGAHEGTQKPAEAADDDWLDDVGGALCGHGRPTLRGRRGGGRRRRSAPAVDIKHNTGVTASPATGTFGDASSTTVPTSASSSASGTPPTTPTTAGQPSVASPYSVMKVAELRAACQLRNLDTTGIRATLMQRLQDADAAGAARATAPT